MNTVKKMALQGSYKQIAPGCMITGSGLHMSLKDPKEHMIDLKDIAAGLGNMCRYGGQLHIGVFYSVAQHSVLAAALAPAELRPAVLLHDAAEAYIGDMIRPLKMLIGAPYDDIETKFREVIYRHFKVDIDLYEKALIYDMEAFELEWDQLHDGGTALYDTMCRLESYGGWPHNVGFWTPAEGQVNLRRAMMSGGLR